MIIWKDLKEKYNNEVGFISFDNLEKFEGYSLSKTAITELKKRYKHIYILFDSDNAGINDSQKLASETGFKQLTLPKTEKGKDISDIYHFYGKQYLISMISELLVS